MTNRSIRLFQSLFFRGMKTEPKESWRYAYEEFGKLETFILKRSDRNLNCLRIFAPQSSGARKVVILAHPISRKGKYYFAERGRIPGYLERGYDVVCFDFNGFGESDNIDLHYWRDSENVINYLKELAPKHLIVHGLSFGAFHTVRSIQALPLNSSAIFENVARSPMDYWRRWLVGRFFVTFFESLRFEAFREMNIIQFFRTLDRHDLKLLFIGCEHDEFTPVDEMRDLFENAPEPKKFVVIEGAGHYEAPERDLAGYWGAIEFALAT